MPGADPHPSRRPLRGLRPEVFENSGLSVRIQRNAQLETAVAPLAQPGLDLLGLVGGAVVEDHMDQGPGVAAPRVAPIEQVQSRSRGRGS